MPIFSNKEEDFFKNIIKLPEVLVDIVYDYVPLSTKLFLTKKDYCANHHIVKSLIDRRQYENYIRSMVRQDNFFVLSFLITENILIWIRIRNYLYKDQTYENYIFFLHEYCIENESTRCKEIINRVIKIFRFNKNRHKKRISNNLRWRH